jgi:hypothetical protein
MKMLFPGFFRESEEDIKKIWGEAVFVFDANIFLNLYRYSDSTREDFINIFKQVKDRVWVSHQAVDEYLQNRLTVIKSQVASYESTVKEMSKLQSTFKNSRQHPFVKESSSESLKTLFSQIKHELDENKNTHVLRMVEDPIKAELASIFESNIGSPYSKEELDTVFENGEKRYKDSIPPGYKDASKAKDDDSLKAKSRKFGDLIVWLQTLSMAKDASKDVVFVTDENKEDRWISEHGMTISPRPELIKEFKDETGHNILMYRADKFVNEAKKIIGSVVDPKTVEEIRLVQVDKDIIFALRKYQPFNDLVFYLYSLNLPIGSKIPSERHLAEEISSNRSGVREHLGRLESYGYIEINHGKSTILIKELSDLEYFFIKG